MLLPSYLEVNKIIYNKPPVWASNLFVAMASISSIKMMAGAFSLANLNTSLTILGPSPKYFWTNSEPTTRIKAAERKKKSLPSNFEGKTVKPLNISKRSK